MQKHKTDLSDLQEEEEATEDIEIPKIVSDISVLDNEVAIKQTSLSSIRKDNQMLQEHVALFD